jgi:uncharacterized protein YjbI with pentapeptide repeats
MANPEHLAKLKEGVEMWNRWRAEHSEIVNPDLREAPPYKADLRGADLREADLGDACLSRANLWETCLQMADLSGADLREADFRGADLGHANLSRANAWGAYLHGANLGGADLSETDLRNTDLTSTNLSMAICRRANFEGARLVGTNLEKVDLNGARVYGISAWDLRLRDSMQQNLVITPEGQPTITVDDLEVAQFIYLLLNNEHVRRVIDTITSKVVLILGRFTTERKTVLDAIHRDNLYAGQHGPVHHRRSDRPKQCPARAGDGRPRHRRSRPADSPRRTAGVRDVRRSQDEIPLGAGAVPIHVQRTPDHSPRRPGDCSCRSEGEGASAEGKVKHSCASSTFQIVDLIYEVRSSLQRMRGTAPKPLGLLEQLSYGNLESVRDLYDDAFTRASLPCAVMTARTPRCRCTTCTNPRFSISVSSAPTSVVLL